MLAEILEIIFAKDNKCKFFLKFITKKAKLVSNRRTKKRFFFFYLIYFEIRYLTAIIFDVTRITIQANNTNTNPV